MSVLHCLLWSLNSLVTRKMLWRQMQQNVRPFGSIVRYRGVTQRRLFCFRSLMYISWEHLSSFGCILLWTGSTLWESFYWILDLVETSSTFLLTLSRKICHFCSFTQWIHIFCRHMRNGSRTRVTTSRHHRNRTWQDKCAAVLASNTRWRENHKMELIFGAAVPTLAAVVGGFASVVVLIIVLAMCNICQKPPNKDK